MNSESHAPRDEVGRWHPLIVPVTDVEKQQAVDALQCATGWQLGPRHLLQLLDPWFSRGWCPRAILHGMDRLPSGEPQPTHRYRDHAELIETRLSAWIDGFGKRRPAPVEASDRERVAAWQREHRVRTAHGPGATNASEPVRDRLREQSTALATGRRRDAIERCRAADARIASAFDALGPGPRMTEPEEHFKPDGLHQTTREHDRDTTARRLSGMDHAGQEIITTGRASVPMLRVLRARYRDYRLHRSLSDLDDLITPESPETRQDRS